MTDRDRLIEIIINADTYDSYDCKLCAKGDDACDCCFAEKIADYLLANGVIVPPCYIGQEIWYLCKHYDGSVEIQKGKISMLQQKADKSWKFRFSVNSSAWDFKIDDIGVRYFLTREEAERKLRKEDEGK